MRDKVYRYYVLAVLTVMMAFNFLDRQVVTIVAPYLKEDLGVSDAQIGLLFGTAFALFYAVFGLPLAKLADGWSRVKTISLGLTFWSLMTTVSGMASNFAQLGSARVGVGIGEASASPAAYSLLQDYFPKAMRATVLAIYSAGIYVGAGAALVFGGEVIKYWDANYTAATAPFGLSGWQATYIAFGVPGLLLALLVITTVREPTRGAIDGIPTAGDPAPFKSVMGEFAAMLPPWNWLGFTRQSASRQPLLNNLALAIGLTLLAVLTIKFTDGLLKPEKRAVVGAIGSFAITTNMVQWIAIAIGIYCSASWMQTIRMRDAPTFALIANRGFICLTLFGGFMSYISYGLSPFIFLYAKTEFGVGAEAGLTLGLITAVAGGLGASFGGFAGDFWKKSSSLGRMLVMGIAALGSAATIVLGYSTGSLNQFYWLAGINIFIHIMWLGPCAATIQDLVLPRMRGAATAVFFLGTTIIGLGLGPYVTGLISDVSGDLQMAMICSILVMPVILATLFIAMRTVPALEASLIVRARAAGEAV